MVFENDAGFPASGATAVSYWEDIGSPEIAVLADTERAVLTDTPWAGNFLPGKCVLTPAMEMLECTTGHGNEALLEAIVEHAS